MMLNTKQLYILFGVNFCYFEKYNKNWSKNSHENIKDWAHFLVIPNNETVEMIAQYFVETACVLLRVIFFLLITLQFYLRYTDLLVGRSASNPLFEC